MGNAKYGFHIKKSRHGWYYMTIQAKNGQTIATSEMYTRKQAARNAVVAVCRAVVSGYVIDETDPDSDVMHHPPAPTKRKTARKRT